MKRTITLPHNFRYRGYQRVLAECLDTKKRGFFLWHRRAGKDLACWNLLIEKAIERTGTYWYVLPTYEQAKKTVWNAITNDGSTFFDFIPDGIIQNKNGTEMKVTLINGSIIQLVGSDKYDGLRGANPIGVVFSEFAFQHPIVWERIVKPILNVNNGWALFNTTPNGENHASDLFQMAEENEDWVTQVLTIDDTNVLTEEDMDKERREGIDEATIQQEYYCSFEAITEGVVYRHQIDALGERVCSVPYDPNTPVDLFMDLGKADTTAILMVQRYGKEIRIIDSYENFGLEVQDYIDYLKEKPYKYGTMYLPHDAFDDRLGMKKNIAGQFKDGGFDIGRVKNIKISAGFQFVRKLFPRFWFDKEKTKELRRSLSSYKYKFDPLKKTYSKVPEHNFASHYADALRYLAVAWIDDEPDDYRKIRSQYTRYIETGQREPENPDRPPEPNTRRRNRPTSPGL